MKKYLLDFLIVVLILGGVGLLLFPVISDHRNRAQASALIVTYNNEIDQKSEKEKEKMLQDAREHNRVLSGANIALDGSAIPGYEQLLNVTRTGIMGYLEIEKIGVQLPIYHGVDSGVLQIGVGHMPNSSLPVGGESSHCVLSSHRGLPTAKLFTDLDQVVIGDVFTITVADEMLLYQVDQIKTVLPEEMRDLAIVPGEDLCTLVTCTPYGINSHRLLVRGRRVIPDADAPMVVRVANDAIQVEPLVVATILAIPTLGLVSLAAFLVSRSKKNREKEEGKA